MDNYFSTNLGKIINADCFDIFPEIEDSSIDMILADLPYGTTACKWDTVLPLDKLWVEYKRIIKDGCPIALTAINPFAANLIMSNPKWFKYDWVWEKNAGSNFGVVKYQPMREHEMVLVFGKGRTTYKPIMQERAPSGKARVQTAINYDTKTEVYHDTLHNKVSSKRPNLRYPRSVQKFNRDRGLHPTQKPLELFEYLIKTYTNEGDLVLDNTAGSCTTGVAADQLNREWICIEKELEYCEKAKGRF